MPCPLIRHTCVDSGAVQFRLTFMSSCNQSKSISPHVTDVVVVVNRATSDDLLLWCIIHQIGVNNTIHEITTAANLRPRSTPLLWGPPLGLLRHVRRHPAIHRPSQCGRQYPGLDRAVATSLSVVLLLPGGRDALPSLWPHCLRTLHHRRSPTRSPSSAIETSYHVLPRPRRLLPTPSQHPQCPSRSTRHRLFRRLRPTR